MEIKKQKYKIDFKYNISIFWSFLRNYKLMLALLILIVILQQGKTILDKFLFKILIDKGANFVSGIISQSVILNIVLIVFSVFLITSLLNVVSNWFLIHLNNKLDSSLIFDLKNRFFDHIVGLDHEFHVTHKTGSLISRLTRGASAIERMTDNFIFNLFPLVFQILIAAGSIIYFSIAPAIAILLTAVSFIVLSIYVQRKQEPSNVLANKTEDLEKGITADLFTNIDPIKYFGKEEFIKQKHTNLTENTRKNFIKYWDYFRWLSAGQSLILGIGTLAIIYFPIKEFLAGTMTLGTLTFIYTVYIGMIGYMFGFVHGIRDYYRAMADFQELFDYGKIKKQILDKPNAKDLEIKQGTVEFKNMDFSYGKRKIFKNFSLKVPANKKIALVGHSGCGKTTLVKLLYRMYDVNSGAILIDGKDIRNIKQESLREEMSMVPQEAVLFDDTIYNNVKFSNPKATRQEVLRAIKFAQLDKIIKDFPNKENTIVGERGVRLSGGEKQRVSIARAILSNKKILVLDEATSSLDSETEHEIQKDLVNLMQGRTSIVIAHRLSTIMTADMIVVMKKGEIVQIGTHNQLISQPGEYKKLWELQKGGYIK
ncbi:MAG: ABC transporter ATP-binding protein [Candidatus Pacearchaeota archaeon]